jgi:DNA repair exonuclease SbcCD ATPase subunit
MIRSLTLTAFGKFARETFDLAPVTVVYGPNEAGKTTFFDGLFQALCRPSEAKKAGKVLKDRYGTARQASAAMANEAPITDEEFLSLYAIRAGDLNLRLDQGTDWMEKLKARLFHGGVDPAVLIAEFQKRSSDSRSVLVNKDLERARQAAAEAQGTLEKLRREREGHLAREREVGEMEASLARLRARLDAARAEAGELERELETEGRIAQRQKWSARLARWEEWKALEAEAAGLAPFAEDRRGEYEALARAARELAEKLAAGRGRREQCAASLAETRAEARTAREAADAASPLAALAQRLSERARSALASGSIGLGIGGVAAAAACLLAGLAGAIAAHGLAALGAMLAGLVAGAVSLLASARFRQGAAARAREEALARAKDEWIAASARDDGVAALSSLEGFAKAMDEKGREKDAAEARAREAAGRCEIRQADLERAEAELARLAEAETAARRDEGAWLRERGSDSPAAYDRKVMRAAELKAELAKRRAEKEAWDEGRPAGDWRLEADRKLRDLDEAGVPAAGRDDASIQALRNRKARLQREIEEGLVEEAGLIDRKAGAAGEIRGALGKLAGEIVTAEYALAAAEDLIRRLESDKRAAALALSIFKEIGEGTDLLLAGLSREIGSMLARILPGDRAVALAGLDEGRILAGDAAGASRALPNLSTGTQHALVLAAKLALARKHREGSGLLVLDEPFTAMDEARETRALEMLREFHLRHGWQIILLTKEVRLKDKMIALFGDTRLIELRND